LLLTFDSLFSSRCNARASLLVANNMQYLILDNLLSQKKKERRRITWTFVHHGRWSPLSCHRFNTSYFLIHVQLKIRYPRGQKLPESTKLRHRIPGNHVRLSLPRHVDGRRARTAMSLVVSASTMAALLCIASATQQLTLFSRKPSRGSKQATWSTIHK
jgi:hypothetical protein